MATLMHTVNNSLQMIVAIANGAPIGPCGACGQIGHLSQNCKAGSQFSIHEDVNFVSDDGSRHPIPKSRSINSKFGSASGMPSSAKFLKEVLSDKRKWKGGEMVKLNEECLAILQNKLPPKLKDPGSFSIPCTIGNNDFDKALCDLDSSIKYPRGIVEDVLVKMGKFIIPVDFIVLDMEEDKNMALILGRPFLATSRALIDVQKGQITLRVNDEHVVFNVFKPMKYMRKNEHDIFAIDSINATRTDNVHLVKCEDPKKECIKNSNRDNLQGLKEEHGDVPNFVDIGQEVKTKLQKASEDKWRQPNRMKRWRKQVDENVELYKEHTNPWNESHMRKRNSRMVTSNIINTRTLLEWIGKD
ncbi:hypothetical protein Sango_1915700 [Sesamum angolense]|uniref:CCHC-type domain-containing protein n=1 Tax=Sesamum angolense TaxID=2727404 RepID=A0AAE1WDR9_9LAMI|nr:hypothetical protein Sango_1915700 [Sesamum angolense]